MADLSPTQFSHAVLFCDGDAALECLKTDRAREKTTCMGWLATLERNRSHGLGVEISLPCRFSTPPRSVGEPRRHFSTPGRPSAHIECPKHQRLSSTL